jgi:anti-sigma factor (TIGR02949 family)
MPDDRPTKSECADTLTDLQRFLDGEMDDTERTYVLEHLDACIECFHAYDFQAELKQIVAAKCGNDPVPADLLARLERVCNGEDPESATPSP